MTRGEETVTRERVATTRDRGAHVGPGSIPTPTWPTPAKGAHGLAVGASAGPELDHHERVSAAHARLAELHSEIAGIHHELAQVELAAGAETRLMERVPESSKTRQLLTVNGLAELLQVDAKTIRAWRERRQLPPAVKIGGVIRWDAADIDRWLSEKREVAQ